MDRGAWWATVHRVAESDTAEVSWHACTHMNPSNHEQSGFDTADKEADGPPGSLGAPDTALGLGRGGWREESRGQGQAGGSSRPVFNLPH